MWENAQAMLEMPWLPNDFIFLIACAAIASHKG
eukprot:CAMPEP_0177544036 /NCGR_PEP_ID=MMETSP0369-20130122/61762_1 /TAXON_ID=447022 ORGANISM="Scrippsiella hangoei-like, Strain SHHI-4" /NCGR_SAMPLE_ID=MMETSP0369 /ASSEMBLY_ACC=CAM_ASM_000364 /LENGTH=32 /DNA_ID= /DNA_START= /DNA_END= /DNA_ORIENTATION=